MRPFDDKMPRVAPSAYVDETAVVIGDVSIGEDSSLWPMVVARGDVHRIEIGARSNIQDGTVLHVTHRHPGAPDGYGLHLGDEITIGHRAVLHGCTIDNRCLIGIGAIVMDGARIEPYVLLAAGSLVPPGKVLDSGHLWLGNPVRRIRPLTETERGWIEYSAAHYVRLKDRYLG
jgi:carbonic anhydrase/acetyltransferase-like protein (isoleucine patch superfamily)